MTAALESERGLNLSLTSIQHPTGIHPTLLVQFQPRLTSHKFCQNYMEANNCHNPFCRHCKEVVFTKHLIPLITTLWERKFDEHGFVQGYTRTAKEIISAGKGGCSWCYELTSSLRELEDYRRDEPKFFLGKRGRKESDITLRIELHFSFLMTSQNGQVGVLVHAGNDSVKLKAYLFNITKPYAEHPIFPVLENGIYFGSEECFRGIKSFTRQCDAQHGLMRSQALRGERRRQELPARVVDVKADTLRIVEVDTIVPEDLVYGALSYCWGTEQQYVLTTETLEQKRITLSSKRIPAAISDAIEVTRKVGLKYLWIDALYVSHGECSTIDCSLTITDASFKMMTLIETPRLRK